MNHLAQLTLAVQLPDDENFASFQLGDNHAVVNLLQDFINPNGLSDCPTSFYMFGAPMVGKSHLLHASCSYGESLGLSTFCMSFSQLTQLSTEVLEGLEQLDLVCLDDIELIAGNEAWQVAVFDLFNRLIEQNKKIIIAGNDNVKNINITLPDLVSRLSWGYSEQIKALGEDDKIIALQYRAIQRGMQLSDDVARFLLNRLTRDMKNLITALDLLDKASIRDQRKITIPFIKEVLLSL